MKITKTLLILVVLLAAGGLFYYLSSSQKPAVTAQNPQPSVTLTPVVEIALSATPFPDTKSAITAVLADKYKKPVSDVHVTVQKEVQGYASGSVLFGKGGLGEGGMWLAVLGNGWNVVWDGNGSVDCGKMRTDYGFPDTILKPNFCD